MIVGQVVIDFALSKTEGPFVSKEDLINEMQGAMEQADPGEFGGLGANGNSCWEVSDWQVTVS